MADSATPNLPARDFEKTRDFYAKLGFSERYRDPHWMILERGTAMLEFFPWPDLDPATSSFGACLRLDDLDGFYAMCRDAGIPEIGEGWPRLRPPATQPWGARLAFLLDLDGSVVRVLQN